ncbi:hypothetical protein Misp01_25860 [Microtetraspora sp. NBRC 13810]|nr:hypothetical protein Misp01_25860 [Microtetraspora sp. NBRC 13810]
MRQLLRDDLALLTEGAGHQRDVRALRRVPGHRRARRDRLIIGMGVYEQQAPIFHDPSLTWAGDGTATVMCCWQYEEA